MSNIEIKNTKKLSVQLSLGGLSFLVTDSGSKKVVFFSETIFKQQYTPEELLVSLQAEISNHKELQGTFKEVTVIYATNLYTLVPTSLFDKSKVSEYLKFNSKILSGDFIDYDTLDSYNLSIVYIPFVNINNYLFDLYGDFNYYHSTTVLLEYLLKKEKNNSETKVFINIVNDFFELIIINKGNLILCNSYEYKTPEDFIYYVLFVLEQLKINPDTVELLLSGSIKREDSIFAILYTYIRNVDFFNPQNSLLEIEGVETHSKLLLKIKNQCELSQENTKEND